MRARRARRAGRLGERGGTDRHDQTADRPRDDGGDGVCGHGGPVVSFTHDHRYWALGGGRYGWGESLAWERDQK